MKDEFLKERYNYELQRKEQLTSALTLPVGILTAIVGALAAMARSFTYDIPIVTGLFIFFLGGGLVSAIGCVYRLWRAYHAQTYIYLPLLQQLENWEEDERQWRSYVVGSGGEIPPDEDDFETWLRKRIIDAADRNTKSNDQRSKWMHQSRVWLFALFCFAAVASIPYVADQVRFRMATKTDQAPKAVSSPAPATPSSVPQRPSFPENRAIKEGTGGETPNVQKKQ